MILTECPHCHQQYQIPPERVGTPVSCRQPGCLATFSANPLAPSGSSTASGLSPQTMQQLQPKRATPPAPQVATATSNTPPVVPAQAFDARPVFGRFFMLLGLIQIYFYALIFKTSVPSGDATEFPREMHNLGLMASQIGGLIVGGSFLICGTMLYTASGKVPNLWDRLVMTIMVVLLIFSPMAQVAMRIASQ